jgi:hypothetical protein
VPAAAVPASVAVPLLLLTKVTPEGSAPEAEMFIAAPVGTPVVVTVNEPGEVEVKLVAFALVICGDRLTWNDCCTCGAAL